MADRREEIYQQPVPESLDPDNFDWGWYRENYWRFSEYLDVFTRRPIELFRSLVGQARSQADEELESDGSSESITANTVLDFINPLYQGNVGMISKLQTLGYFLSQRAVSLGSQRGIKREVSLGHLRNIDEKRVNVLSAIGADNPYIWSSARRIKLDPLLGKAGDPVEEYVTAVEGLFIEIERTFSEQDPESLKAYLAFAIAEGTYALENDIGRGGEPMNEAQRAHMVERVQLLKDTIGRLFG